jgi:hypothetical protein
MRQSSVFLPDSGRQFILARDKAGNQKKTMPSQIQKRTYFIQTKVPEAVILKPLRYSKSFLEKSSNSPLRINSVPRAIVYFKFSVNPNIN